jgi:formylglycine-generating enzyme required for sulfatase activity
MNRPGRIGMVVLLLACLPVFLSAQIGKRVALVIGNSSYKNNPLASPVNDAADMAAALKRCGFDTELAANLDFRGMSEAVDRFSDKAVGADLALFYYSGHGAQADNNNYLIPVDMDGRGSGGSPSEQDLKYYALAVGYIADSLESVKAKASVFILDACRSYPVRRTGKAPVAGLVPYQAPEGVAMLYATRAGDVSNDGGVASRNSVYTSALLSLMETPGISLLDLASKVAEKVKTDTGGRQKPSITSEITGVVYLKPGVAVAGAVNSTQPAAPDPTPPEQTAQPAAPATAPSAQPAQPAAQIEQQQPPTDMISIKGGAFTMGSPPNEGGRESDEVQHQVSIGGFSLAKYETTVAEFRDFAQATGYKTTWEIKSGTTWRNPGFTQGDNDPVVCVSWYDAIAYCNWRSVQEGRKPAYSYSGKGTDYMSWPSGWNTEMHNNIKWDRTSNGYRLPTEAEWEYAARASGSGPQTTAYAGRGNMDEVSWYGGNSGNRTHPVGQKKANGVGLYDMSGNVWEWCWDWYGDYGTGAQTDPSGLSSGSNRVRRGGSWISDASDLRVADRDIGGVPWHADTCRGFRVCVSSAPSAQPAAPVKQQQVTSGMVSVQGGTFTMGSHPSEAGHDSNEIQHQVSVGGFSLAKYETTVAEFRAFAQATGYKTSAEIRGKAWVCENNDWTEKTGASWRNPGFVQGDNEPVVCVSWYDAVAYCNWRSAQEGRKPAYSYSGKGPDSMSWPSGWNTETHNNIQWDRTPNGYRLPTEAEWEYTARASGSGPQTTPWAGSNNVDEVGWYGGNSGNRTHPVGQKKANGVGLYDMSGNVWEWCWDWYGDYSTGTQTDPAGPSSGANRVDRGGSWLNAAAHLRVAIRDGVNPWDAGTHFGFRLCVSAAPSAQPAAPAPALSAQSAQPTAQVEQPQAPAGMVFVKGGTFTMGSPPFESGKSIDEVQHQVSVGGFSLAMFETTVAEFRAFAQATGYKTSAEILGKAWAYQYGWTEKTGASWRNPGFTQGDNEPVVCVSWYDAVAYCNWRSAQEGRKPAYSYSGKGTDYMSWPSGWNGGCFLPELFS